MKKVLLLCLMMLVWSFSAHADQIVLYSTGVDDANALLPGGTIDPHYSIFTVTTAIPTGQGEPTPLPLAGPLLMTDQSALVIYDVSYWVANGPRSKWIAPSANTIGVSGALYTYVTAFDLTGLDPATARITGSWAVDDPGWMFLNGELVAELPFGWMFRQLYGLQVAPNAPAYTANHDFDLAGGFLPGVNTLEFVAWNSGGGPTGVRVEITSATADPAARTVMIDIKPGSDPNCFNSNGRGVLPVAVLGAADFAADAVDPASVRLQGLSAKKVGKTDKLLAHYEDVNGDGYLDLVVQFEDSSGALLEGITSATLTGLLSDGTKIEGSDSICLVP